MLNRYFITDDPAKYTRTYTLPDLKDSFSIQMCIRDRENGYQFFLETPTNQIFIILEDEILHDLERSAEDVYKRQPVDIL